VLVDSRDGESVPGSISGRDQVEVKVRVTSPLLDQQSSISPQPLRRGSFTIVAPARRSSAASVAKMAAVSESIPEVRVAAGVEQAAEAAPVSEEDSTAVEDGGDSGPNIQRTAPLALWINGHRCVYVL
jgi:hypothetical protein